VAGRHQEGFAERRARRAEVDDPELVLAAALRFLEARSRSIAEVRRRLTQAGYRGELIEAAIARLSDYGVLDDEAFARSWIESRDRARPRGERAIARELAQKGVDRELAGELLTERRAAAEPEGGPDLAGATRLLERHDRTLARVPDVRVRRQRAYALLARNGFGPDTIREAIGAWLEANAELSGAAELAEEADD
jgi:regulatory protein